MKKPLVFLDADVIFAGAAAPTKHGASHVVLRLGEITLIECVTSTQVVTEEDRPCLWGPVFEEPAEAVEALCTELPQGANVAVIPEGPYVFSQLARA